MKWPMTTYTDTRDGQIDHLMCRTADGQPFLAPVKTRMVKRNEVRDMHEWRPVAVRDRGRLVYMLPGGLEIAV